MVHTESGRLCYLVGVGDCHSNSQVWGVFALPFVIWLITERTRTGPFHANVAFISVIFVAIAVKLVSEFMAKLNGTVIYSRLESYLQ